MTPPNLNDIKYKKIDGGIDLELYDTDEALYWKSIGEVIPNNTKVLVKRDDSRIQKQIEKINKDSMLPPPIKLHKLKFLYSKLNSETL